MDADLEEERANTLNKISKNGIRKTLMTLKKS